MSQTLANTLPASEEHCPHCGAVLVWGAGPACPEGCRLDPIDCATCGEELHTTDGGTVYCPSGCAQGREEDA